MKTRSAVGTPSGPEKSGGDAGDAKPRVLILDDEPMITTILRRMIGQDYDCHVSHSSVEALDSIRNGARYDVILCDLMMPEITGVDVFAEVQSLDPAQARRMIMMTGGAFTAETSDFLERISNPRIEKPFDAARVRAAMAQVLDMGDFQTP
jgi:CheY-like chemotaxis protein